MKKIIQLAFSFEFTERKKGFLHFSFKRTEQSLAIEIDRERERERFVRAIEKEGGFLLTKERKERMTCFEPSKDCLETRSLLACLFAL